VGHKSTTEGDLTNSSEAAGRAHPSSVNGLLQINLAKESKGMGCVALSVGLAVFAIVLLQQAGVSSLWWLALTAAAFVLLLRPLVIVRHPRIWGSGLAFSGDRVVEVRYSDSSPRAAGFEDIEQGKGALHELTEWEEEGSVPSEGRTLALTLQPDSSESFKIGRATLMSASGIDLDLSDTYVSGDPAFVLTHDSSFAVVRSGQISWMRGEDSGGEHLLMQLGALAEICPSNLDVALTFTPRGESPIVYGALASLVGAHRRSKLTKQLENRTLVNQDFCDGLFSLVERHGWLITNLPEGYLDRNGHREQ